MYLLTFTFFLIYCHNIFYELSNYLNFQKDLNIYYRTEMFLIARLHALKLYTPRSFIARRLWQYIWHIRGATVFARSSLPLSTIRNYRGHQTKNTSNPSLAIYFFTPLRHFTTSIPYKSIAKLNHSPSTCHISHRYRTVVYPVLTDSSAPFSPPRATSCHILYTQPISTAPFQTIIRTALLSWSGHSPLSRPWRCHK